MRSTIPSYANCSAWNRPRYAACAMTSSHACIQTIYRCCAAHWSSTSKGAARITGSSTGCATARDIGAGSKTAAGRSSTAPMARSCACLARAATFLHRRPRRNSNVWRPRYSKRPAKALPFLTRISYCWRSIRRTAKSPATPVKNCSHATPWNCPAAVMRDGTAWPLNRLWSSRGAGRGSWLKRARMATCIRNGCS
ncbi:hypothetical protein D3C80_814780 [compost metagenome]